MRAQRAPHITIATNNGDIGGGEIMMLSIAQALRDEGIAVTILAPSEPAAIADEAQAHGLAVIRLQAATRRQWMTALRRWAARARPELLWCNGLVPSTATMGLPGRIVHLHQRPAGVHRLLLALARKRADALLVPSRSMLASVPGARVLSNWTSPLKSANRVRRPGEPFTVGFLGRVSMEKGIGVLSEAMHVLEMQSPGAFRLVLAGEGRFVSPKAQKECEDALKDIAPMTDKIGWADRDEFFSQIDLLAVPSISPESFGLVAAEAMAARVPTLVSDSGALPGVVGEGYPLVAPAGDAAGLAAKILGFAAGNIRIDLSAQHERWRAHFSPEAGQRGVNAVITAVQTEGGVS
jgi:glycosyltransferase involved in cell wall biosynthesis